MNADDEISRLKEKVLQREQKVKEIQEKSTVRTNNIFNDVTERAIGRVAIISFSLMILNEFISGESFSKQFESYGLVTVVVSMVSFLLSPKV
jgi:hypothetical protein